ncbi:MAG: cytochrome C [Flavobacteriaceae bacterium]|nr:MAG: cytochrome C [Flavobacteriaceae bacterium]
MKKSILMLGLAAFMFVSCGDKKKEEVKKEVETKVEKVEEVAKEVVADTGAAVEAGKKLFTEKGCVACHQETVKIVGPSVKDIAAKYVAEKGNMVKFLKGEAPAIVDTDVAQVAIMKANLDGFVKDLNDDQLASLAAYMSSVK